MTSNGEPFSAEGLFRVDGLVAVVTGGGSGIGWLMAKTLAENGAKKVYIVGRRQELLEEVSEPYDNMIPLPCDITDTENLKQLVDTIEEDEGYINLLCANAGIGGPHLADLKPKHTLQDFVDLAMKSSTDEFNAVYDLNLTAVYYSIVSFLPMLEKGNKSEYGCRSQVIATASVASFLRNPRCGFAYLSSKAGLVAMMKAFASFCVPWSIRFNTIAAGLFPTEMSESHFAPFRISRNKKITEEGYFSKSYQPSERAGGEQDMAGLMLFMTSKAGAFHNGGVIVLDGGKLAIMPATY